MKKILITLVAVIAIAQFSYGQNSSPWPSNGNVGIGTTSPSYKLEVADASTNGRAISIVQSSTSGTVYGITSNATGAATTNRAGYFNATGAETNQSLYLDGPGSGANNYAVYSPTTAQSYFNGNVGIGISTPDAKLTVNGTIHSKEVKVDLNVPGPDYVFNDDYKPITLSEIKDYVVKNHHLPEIPSAAQMAKDGINLGDMNTKLLKKVEELTLYAIQQKEENQALKEKQRQAEARITRLEKVLSKLTANK